LSSLLVLIDDAMDASLAHGLTIVDMHRRELAVTLKN